MGSCKLSVDFVNPLIDSTIIANLSETKKIYPPDVDVVTPGVRPNLNKSCITFSSSGFRLLSLFWYGYENRARAKLLVPCFPLF